MVRPHKPLEQRASERVAVLMTPAEKAAYADRASSMGLSLGQFFREAGAAYAASTLGQDLPDEALDAALGQLVASTAQAEKTLDRAMAEVRASLYGER